MSEQLPPNPSFEQLKKQAKDLLKAHQAGDFEACSRFQKSLPRFSDSPESVIQSEDISLADAQLVIAHEYGFENWAKMKGHIGSLTATNASESQLRRVVEALASDDMKTLKTLLEDNSDLKQQIRDSHRIKSQLLASISHELYTPLTHIKDGVNGLLSKLTNGPQTDWKKTLSLNSTC